MILSNISSPEKSLYVIGANIISLLTMEKHYFVDPMELYEKYKRQHPDISLSYVMFGLDWLFIIGAIKLTSTGDIELCS